MPSVVRFSANKCPSSELGCILSQVIGVELPNDILGVILHFAPGGYDPGDENWDRPPVMGGAGAGSTWNRGSPDGVIDLPNDILGVILQFNPGGC